MNTPEGAKAAIAALNGKDWKGRSLTVNEARPREERGPSTSRGYGSQGRSRY
jgi:RNA recognition motif-containing protein